MQRMRSCPGTAGGDGGGGGGGGEAAEFSDFSGETAALGDGESTLG